VSYRGGKPACGTRVARNGSGTDRYVQVLATTMMATSTPTNLDDAEATLGGVSSFNARKEEHQAQ